MFFNIPRKSSTHTHKPPDIHTYSPCHHHTNPHTPSQNVPRVTVKLHIAEFPVASVAAHSTLVTPNGNVDPESVLHKMSGDVSTLSVAIGLGQDACEDVVTILLGQFIVGGTWSICSRGKQNKRKKMNNALI